MAKTDAVQLDVHERNAPETPTNLDRKGVTEISSSLRQLLADVFALYVKTKNFHWHMSGRHFRDYHQLLDEHSEQIFAMTDDIAERARKIGGTTIRSISHIGKHQRLKDNDEELVTPGDMLCGALRRQPALNTIPALRPRTLRTPQRHCYGKFD